MNYYTTNCYEMKRAIFKFSKNMSNGLNKGKSKFIFDMQYGLSKGKSCLISEISRSLNEDIKLKNTIERLCDNLQSLSNNEVKIINENYLNKIRKYFPDEPICIFDDSDIAKRYGKKFEDLDKVIDASDPDKKIVSGYHVCEAVILGKNEKQPISVYSKIYSCKSKGFESKNKYTLESIDTTNKVLDRKSNMIFDRGYDDNKIIDYIDESGNYFVIRYLQNLEYDGCNVQQQLLAKIFTNKYNNEELASTFEQEYTYGPNNFIIKNDSQDKYSYISNGNVIYGINEFEQVDICHYLNGICFENSNVDVSRYLPYHIKSDDQIFNVDNATSIIIFRGGTDDVIHHNFTISKIKSLDNAENKQSYDIYLNYEAIRWEHFNDENGMPQYKKVVVARKNSKYSKIENGNVTSSEIKLIIDDLDMEFKDNIFIQLVINELRTFANKIDIQKGIMQENLDPLSPKLFINKSFDEIFALISSNKDDYFKLAAEQFNNLTNSSSLKEKGQIKVLK